MVFQRKSVRPWMEEEEELKEEMKETMLMANHVKTQNPSQWQKHLSNHGQTIQTEVPLKSKPTFNKWLKGKLRKAINDDYCEIVVDFIREYGRGKGVE